MLPCWCAAAGDDAAAEEAEGGRGLKGMDVPPACSGLPAGLGVRWLVDDPAGDMASCPALALSRSIRDRGEGARTGLATFRSLGSPGLERLGRRGWLGGCACTGVDGACAEDTDDDVAEDAEAGATWTCTPLAGPGAPGCS